MGYTTIAVSHGDRELYRGKNMDQAVQIIGLTIMCLGLTGFAVSVIGIIRWYAKHPRQSRSNDDVAR